MEDTFKEGTLAIRPETVMTSSAITMTSSTVPFKPLWCVIHEGQLIAYESHSQAPPRGSVTYFNKATATAHAVFVLDMSNCIVHRHSGPSRASAEGGGSSEENKFVFSIEVVNSQSADRSMTRYFRCRCADEDEYLSWIVALSATHSQLTAREKVRTRRRRKRTKRKQETREEGRDE